MYTFTNYKTKKALKEALARGEKIGVYQPNAMNFNSVPENGIVYLEGPHYPEPHKWYAKGTLENGFLVKVV